LWRRHTPSPEEPNSARSLPASTSIVLGLIAVVLGGQGAPSSAAVLSPSPAAARSPSARPSTSAAPVYLDPSASVPDRVRDLVGRMTLAEKVGQMTLIERTNLPDPEMVAIYGLGGVLSGGGSSPTDNTPSGWADMVDAYQSAALSTRLGIPILYGNDSVHGDGNLRDATIFPHNVGMGATRDPGLEGRVARATAEETAATGVNWNFSPCLCVARDIRWGRTYESFGEDPQLVSDMAAAVIPGYQNATLGVGRASILATAKHFLGDGGTTGGVNEGDTQLSEADLRAIHLPPYETAVEYGVGSVMVSFSSVNGEHMHADGHLITDVLKGELGFGGFVVSDWAGINRNDGVPSDLSPTDVRLAINAGIDMVMVPDNASLFESTLTTEIRRGGIPMTRIDDAVSRILATKFQMGLFEHPMTDRSLAATVGSDAHRALARTAAAESVVVLENPNGLLPLRAGMHLIVAGRDADDMGAQMGGWTGQWQGQAGQPWRGTTILDGFREDVGPSGVVDYSADGSGAAGHDVAIAVIGEQPYAEGQGDRPDGLDLDPGDLRVLHRLESSGVPVLLVLVSGRPMIVTSELPWLAALAAAWLPGSEGAGVADALFGRAPTTGRLPFSWPRSNDQLPLNVGAPGYDPLFPFGYGLTLGS
jgi:beta-glucosidase